MKTSATVWTCNTGDGKKKDVRAAYRRNVLETVRYANRKKLTRHY